MKIIAAKRQTGKTTISNRYDKNGNPMENRLNEQALILYEEDAE